MLCLFACLFVVVCYNFSIAQKEGETMKVTTKELENRIKKAQSTDELKAILSVLPQTTFSVRIDQLCRQYGKTFSQVQVSSGITKSLFYAIVNGTRNPKKDHIIKIGLAIGLSLEEVNELLKLAKLKELYAKNKEDAIVIFGLRNRLPIAQIEELLIDAGVTLRLMER